MIDISMSNISPKLIDVENNRVGSEKVINNINDFSNIHGGQFGNHKPISKLGETYKNGRFPTQLFTNIKNDRYKYVKYIT